MYILFQKVDNSVYKNQSCRSFLTLVVADTEIFDISLDLLINVQCALMVYNFVKLTKRKYAFNCKWVLYNIYEHVYVNQFSHIMQTFGGGVGDYINKIENLKWKHTPSQPKISLVVKIYMYNYLHMHIIFQVISNQYVFYIKQNEEVHIKSKYFILFPCVPILIYTF